MEKFSEVALIVIIALTLIGIPTYYEYRAIDNKIYTNVNNSTSQFQKTVKNKGYVSKEDYDNFLKELSNTGRIYDVELIHTKITYYPLDSSSPDYTQEKPYKEEDFKYFNKTIFKDIYNKPKSKNYVMNIGDNFQVKVYSRKNLMTQIFGTFSGRASDRELVATYGGAISNEG